MNLVRLSYFVAVAEELSFVRAATRLHISQPPLTQQIQRLEKEIGERLFDRSPRRIELTPAGIALLPEARRILEASRRLPALARDAALNQTSTLALGAVPSAIVGVVPPLLSLYAAVTPGSRCA